MNIDEVGNKTGKEVPKRGPASFRKKCGRFPKSIKYWNKENQHRNHSRFQILRKSVCYKIISAPTAHRVLVLKDHNRVEEDSPLSPSKCRLCFGKCVCVRIKHKEYESFIFKTLQHLQTENYHVHYMKKNLRTPLPPLEMESDNKISKDPRMNKSVQIQNSQQKTNLSGDSRFTSELIGLVDTLGKKCTENTCYPSYKILEKINSNSSSSQSPFMAKNSACSSLEPLLVDTELEKKVGSNIKLFPKLKDDLLDPNTLKAIESACKGTWYTYMPNAEISSKKHKLSFSECSPSKKIVCEELNLFSTKNDNVVSRQYIANTHKVPINEQSQVDSQRLKSSGLKTLKTNTSTQIEIKKISEKNESKPFQNYKRSQKTSSQLTDPRLDANRNAKPISLKCCKWSRNVAASSNCLSNNKNRLEKMNAVKSKLAPAHNNTDKQNDISSLQASAMRTELVDPRLKHSKIFPSNLSLCDTKQCSSEKEKAGITGFSSKLDEPLSPSKLSVKSSVQVSSESPTSHIASKPLQVSSSKLSLKTSVCASSVASPKCTLSHPTLPKTKKQIVPELQLNSPSPTEFTSKSMPASPSALSVKTSVCLPSETQANCTNEHLTSPSDTSSVKASLHVSTENQAKRTHDHSTLLEANKHDVVPKKKAKYSSHHDPLSLNKCDINILSVKTASGSAISVKISEYNDSVTGNKIDVEVLSQQLQGDETATIIRKNFSDTNESRVKKFVRNQSSCDISKETLSSPSATLASTVQSIDNLLNSSMKKSTTTFSTSTVFHKRKLPRLDKPTSSLKHRKVSSSELHDKQTSSEITPDRKSDKQASSEITSNRKNNKQASSEITSNRTSDKQASSEVTSKRTSDKEALSEVTFNRKSNKQASSEKTSNRTSNKQASSEVTSNRKSNKASSEVTSNRKSNKQASSEKTSNRKSNKQASSEKTSNRKSDKQASSEIISNRKSNKQASSEITSNRKSMSKSFSQKECVAPNKKCHRTSVGNEKLTHPKHKQQGHSNNLSLLKKSRQKLDKRNTKSVVGSLKIHVVAQCQTKSSIVSLNNIASNRILPFDFKVENFMEEFPYAPIKPQFKNLKLSTIWRNTLCMPLKFAARLSWECYLNYVCSDSITQPTTAMEVFDQFLQNRLSMHLIKHSNLGILSIMKYFAIRALKLYKSKMRKKNSSTRKCLNPSPTDPILKMEVCVDPTKNFHENSLASHTDNTNTCCKIESASNEVEMADSNKFSISTAWIKKNLEWEMFLQCSNLMFCFNLENLKKDSISLLPNACMLQKQFLCNVYSKNENFLSSVILGTPESMFLNTYCQELKYSDFVKEKRHKNNNVSNYKFLCNNYRTVNFFKSMGLNTFCLKSNMSLSNDKSLDIASEKYLTFFKLENEQIYFVKPEMLPSKLSVTYKMCDDICFKKDPKCSIFSSQEITSCKLESDSKCFPQAFDTSCVMKKEISENTLNLPAIDAYKSEPSISYENNCIVRMKIKTTKFSKSLKFQIKDDLENGVVVDSSCVLKDMDALPPLLVQPAALTSLQLPASKVQPCNGSGFTALSATGEQLPASQSCNEFSTTALENTHLPTLEEQMSNGFSTTALSLAKIQVPRSEEQLSNGFSTTVLNATNVQLSALQELQYRNLSDFYSTFLKTSNIPMHTSEVQSCNSVRTTDSNPTSAKLLVLDEQSVQDGEGSNESTCKGMNNLNYVALSKASQADPNIKSQAPPQDLNWLFDSLSSYLHGIDNDTDSMDIDSDESLRNSTESEMLSQDQSEDGNLLKEIFEYFQSSVENFPPSEDSQSLQPLPSNSTIHTDTSMSLIPNISQNKFESSFSLPDNSSNKSMLSFLQESSMPSIEEINSGIELCSTHHTSLESIKEISASNLTKQKTYSSRVSCEVSQPSSKGNSKLNISRKKIMSPHCSPKTSLLPSTSQETLMPGNSTKNIKSQHCSRYVSDLPSSKVAIASNIRKRKSTDCSPAAKKSSLDVLKQSQDSSVLPLNTTSNLSLTPSCETKTSLNCDKNSCAGAVTSTVFQADCHLKGKKITMSSEVLNSAFHGFDLFEEGKPLHPYYQHLLGTGNHVLNLDCIRKDKTELSEEMLESYNFLNDQLVYHRCLLRGLVHIASDPDVDCDMQMDRRIANELEYIEGYELACQALLL